MKRMKDTCYQRILHILNFCEIAGILGFVLFRWAHLPDRIPIHYNWNGEIDGWSGKWSLFLMLGLMVLIYVVFLLVERAPRLWNTGVRVTPKNQAFVYRTLKNMLVTLEFCLLMIFGVLTVFIAYMVPVPVWICAIIFALPVCCIAYFLIRLFVGAEKLKF